MVQTIRQFGRRWARTVSISALLNMSIILSDSVS